MVDAAEKSWPRGWENVKDAVLQFGRNPAAVISFFCMGVRWASCVLW